MRPILVSSLAAVGCMLVSPVFADGLVVTHRLSADLAGTIAHEAVAHCAQQGYAETAVVVDADGVPQAMLRGDRTGAHTLNSANDKAYTSASFKTNTSTLVERAKTAPGFAGLFTQLPHLILVGGGVVIKVGDEVIGAVGAAGAPGGDLDQACSQAGVDKVRDQLR